VIVRRTDQSHLEKKSVPAASHMIRYHNIRGSRICIGISVVLMLFSIICSSRAAFTASVSTSVRKSCRISSLRRAQRRCLHLSRAPEDSAQDPFESNESIYNEKQRQLDRASTLSLAPMMEYTDRHFRHLVRLISSETLVYTEMVGASAVYHEQLDAKEAYRQEHPTAGEEEVKANYNNQYLQRFLAQGTVAPLEGPSTLQLGGSDPEIMYHTAKTVVELAERGVCDYTALNLNCGCPSPKVAGKGCFGAALMDDATLVADVSRAMFEGTDGRLPVTVKCRIGTDTDHPFTQQSYANLNPQEEYSKLCRFIETVASNGVVKSFDVHARIAVLQKSFSPADNRKIPPLKYELVSRLTEDYPELSFSLNGGIDTIAQAKELLEASPKLKGVMIGRAWAADPWRFAMADRLLFGKEGPPVAKNRLEVLKAYGRHADQEEALWDPVKIRRFIVKAVTPLFAGEPNAKRYRIRLDQLASIPKNLDKRNKSLDSQPSISELIVNTALECLSEETLLRTPEESYERFLLQQSGKEQVTEWQAQRKATEAAGDSSYMNTLKEGAV